MRRSRNDLQLGVLEGLKIHDIDIRGFACGIEAHLARRGAKVVKMARRVALNAGHRRGGENRQRFSQNYTRAAPSVCVSPMHKHGAKNCAARDFNAIPTAYLLENVVTVSPGLATLFDLKFPAHLAVACVYTGLTCQLRGKFPPRQTRRHARKCEYSHLFASAKGLIAENRTREAISRALGHAVHEQIS